MDNKSSTILRDASGTVLLFVLSTVIYLVFIHFNVSVTLIFSTAKVGAEAYTPHFNLLETLLNTIPAIIIFLIPLFITKDLNKKIIFSAITIISTFVLSRGPVALVWGPAVFFEAYFPAAMIIFIAVTIAIFIFELIERRKAQLFILLLLTLTFAVSLLAINFQIRQFRNNEKKQAVAAEQFTMDGDLVWEAFKDRDLSKCEKIHDSYAKENCTKNISIMISALNQSNPVLCDEVSAGPWRKSCVFDIAKKTKRFELCDTMEINTNDVSTFGIKNECLLEAAKQTHNPVFCEKIPRPDIPHGGSGATDAIFTAAHTNCLDLLK